MDIIVLTYNPVGRTLAPADGTEAGTTVDDLSTAIKVNGIPDGYRARLEFGVTAIVDGVPVRPYMYLEGGQTPLPEYVLFATHDDGHLPVQLVLTKQTEVIGSSIATLTVSPAVRAIQSTVAMHPTILHAFVDAVGLEGPAIRFKRLDESYQTVPLTVGFADLSGHPADNTELADLVNGKADASRLESLVRDVSEMAVVVDANTGSISAVDREVHDIDARLVNTQARLTPIEADTADLKTRTSALETDVGLAQADITNIQGSIAGIRTDVSNANSNANTALNTSNLANDHATEALATANRADSTADNALTIATALEDTYNDAINRVNQPTADAESVTMSYTDFTGNVQSVSVPTATDATAGVLKGSDHERYDDYDARIRGNMKDVSFAGTYTEVSAVIMKEDGTIDTRQIPNVDHSHAGMMTPAQMKDITDELDSHGTQINALNVSQREQDTKLGQTVNVTGDQNIGGNKMFSGHVTVRDPTYTERENDLQTVVNVATTYILAGMVIAPYSCMNNPDITEVNSEVRYVSYSGLKASGITELRGKMQAVTYDGCRGCQALTKVVCPGLFNIGNNAFNGCRMLKVFDTSARLTMAVYSLANTVALDALILRGSEVCVMTNTNVLNGSAIASGTGYIYVPDNLVETYKTTTNWDVYANQIKPISELPPEYMEP